MKKFQEQLEKQFQLLFKHLLIYLHQFEILITPIAKLFALIYSEKSIPEQWKTAKIIPLHKKGNKDDITNYRPISNLCIMSKISEKLILQQLLKKAKENTTILDNSMQPFTTQKHWVKQKIIYRQSPVKTPDIKT